MITSTSNPRIKQIVQWQTKAKQRRQDDIFLAEGLKMFEEAPPELIREVYLTQSLLQHLESRTQREDKPCDIEEKLTHTGYETVTEEVFSRMSDTRTPQGILTVLKRPAYRMEQLLQGDRPLLVLLEDLQDPGNLGTILRTGEGAGVTGVIMSAQTVDIYNPKTIRATMGSVYRVPFLYVEDMGRPLQRCKKREFMSMRRTCRDRHTTTAFAFGRAQPS